MFVNPSAAQTHPDLARPRISHLRLVGKGARTAVLLNANAKRVTKKVRAAFERIVPSEDLFFSTSLEQAESFARTIIERRYDTVMAGGGDGTIVGAMNQLLNAADEAAVGMYRPALPDIGVLRLGTGNGLGYAVGAADPMEDVLRVLNGQRPQARPLPLMEDTGGNLVFPFASLGYDAQLLNDYVDAWKATQSQLGQTMMKSVAGYFYALGTRTIPQQIKAKTPHLRVVSTGRCSRIDPETEEEIPLPNRSTLFEGMARSVAMGTTPYYGYKLKIFPYAERRSDRFHVRISTASIPYVLSHLPGLWSGNLKSDQIFDFLVEGIRVESDEQLPYQTAGDAMGYRDALEVKLSPRTFRVLDNQ